jgi:hypothetical protein
MPGYQNKLGGVEMKNKTKQVSVRYYVKDEVREKAVIEEDRVIDEIKVTSIDLPIDFVTQIKDLDRVTLNLDTAEIKINFCAKAYLKDNPEQSNEFIFNEFQKKLSDSKTPKISTKERDIFISDFFCWGYEEYDEEIFDDEVIENLQRELDYFTFMKH